MAAGRSGAGPATVLARMARILRAHWPALLVGGLVIFVPVGLLETLDADVQDSLSDADDVLGYVEAVAVALLHTAGALLGQILFAGLISALATTGSAPGAAGLAGLWRELPTGRLILADLAFVAVVVLGLIALLLPGLIFLVWFALIGPVIEVEQLGVRASFRRSRQLVRGRFWLVAGFVLPITLAEEALADLITDASVWSLGEGFLGAWAAGTAGSLITSTLLALAATVLYLELSAPGASPRTPPARRRRPHPARPA